MLDDYGNNTEAQNAENRRTASNLLNNEIESVLFSIGVVKNREDLIEDPLSEVARRGKKTLLIAATVSIIILIFNLFPQRLTISGIEFGPIEKSNLLILLFLANSYFRFSFWFYGSIDFFKWRQKVIEQTKSNTTFKSELDSNANLGQIRNELERLYKWKEQNEQKKYNSLKWNKYENIRKLIDYYFPIIFSAIAIFYCITMYIFLVLH